jgi:hypothetical protein
MKGNRLCWSKHGHPKLALIGDKTWLRKSPEPFLSLHVPVEIFANNLTLSSHISDPFSSKHAVLAIRARIRCKWPQYIGAEACLRIVYTFSRCPTIHMSNLCGSVLLLSLQRGLSDSLINGLPTDDSTKIW